MIIGTAFTLFVVPSIYMLVAKTRTAEAGARDEADDFGEDTVVEGLPAPV
jgi:hypothetical protein